ncbi:DUF11 domain-containing protein [Corynebacterium choanae]|uniref:DUF7507 domain-containing protein n=1 Tax=Corynebacterium choanae TaxID=1862358 RepID=UPI0013DE2D8D|nr:DUF11 domain-containing protein [Corynebacterium choanae]
MQVVHPAVARAATAIDGLQSVEVTSKPVPTKGNLALEFNINCASAGCDGMKIEVQRPKIAGFNAVLQTIPSGLAIENAASDNPTVTYKYSGPGVQSLQLYWTTRDNPAFAGVEEVDWKITKDGHEVTGKTQVELTGSPQTEFRIGYNAKRTLPGSTLILSAVYISKNAIGRNGVTGSFDVELPEEVELLAVLNPELDSRDNYTYEEIVNDRRGQFRVVDPSRFIGAQYIEKTDKGVRVTVDKTLDYGVSTNLTTEIKLWVRVKDDAPVGPLPPAKIGWTDGVAIQSIDGSKTYQEGDPGIAVDQQAPLRIESTVGSRFTKRSTPSSRMKTYDGQTATYEFVVGNYVDGDIKIIDELRPQKCLHYNAKSQTEYKNFECEVSGGDDNYYMNFQGLSVRQIDLIKYDENGKPSLVRGHPELQVVLVDKDGNKAPSQTFPADEDRSFKAYELNKPEGFKATGFEFTFKNVPANSELVFRAGGPVDYPTEMFGDLDYIHLGNDAKLEITPSNGNVITATDPDVIEIYPQRVQPQIEIDTNKDSTINEASDTATLGIRLINLGLDALRPMGYVEIPFGMHFDPSSTSKNVVCSVGNVAEGQVPLDVNKIQWEQVPLGSASGGELWKFTVPENMVLPGESGRACIFYYKITNRNAVDGSYDGAIDSAKPAIAAYLTADNPELKFEPTLTTIPDPRLCGDPAAEGGDKDCSTQHRWSQSTAPVTIGAYSTAVIRKFAKGDRDEENAPWSTWLPKDEERADVSYAHDDASFYVQIGGESSRPLKDYVLYDALPTGESWTKLNHIESDQEAVAGTYPTYDEHGNLVEGGDKTYENTLVPTLTGPIALPSVNKFDADSGQWSRTPLKGTVYYSTSSDPCRPEMGEQKTGPFPASKTECTTFNALGEWHTAEQLADKGIAWDQVRYFRIEFTGLVLGPAFVEVNMKMPKNDANGTGIGDDDIAINRASFRASNSDSGVDLGTVPPAVARVKYAPELKINKSVILPGNGGGTDTADKAFDGADPGDYVLGVGDYVLFKISVQTAEKGIVLESPMIRDLIPAGLEYVETVEDETVGDVVTDYHDAALDEAIADDEGELTADNGGHIVWFPGLLTDRGVVSPDNIEGSAKKATVTLKLRVTGSNVGIVKNFALGSTRDLIKVPDAETCAAQTQEQADDPNHQQFNCDLQAITIAPAVSGSIYDLGLTDTEITKDSSKLASIPAGKVTAHLLDSDGQPVQVNGKDLVVEVDGQGNYKFPKVPPGTGYTVELRVDSSYQATFIQNYSFLPAASPGSSSISVANVIDGGSTDPKAVVAKTVPFTVPKASDGSVNNIVNVDFAVRQIEPNITLEKSADSSTKYAVGSTATFTISGSNTGNVPLESVILTDAWAAARKIDVICTVQSQEMESPRPIDLVGGAVLQPNDRYTCTVSYKVTQQDVDAQEALQNEASIAGRYEGREVSAKDTAEVNVVAAEPGMKIEKVINGVDSQALKPRDEGTFTVTMENTGNVTLLGIGVADRFSRSGQEVPLVCGENLENLNPAAQQGATEFTIDSLAPKQKFYCVGKFIVDKQFFAEQQTETNVVSAVPQYRESGSTELVTLEPVRAEAAVRPIPATPQLDAEKFVLNAQGEAVKETPGTLENSGSMTFRIVLENKGDVRLNEVTVTDSLSGRDEGSADLTVGTCVNAKTNDVVGSSGTLSLEVGDKVNCDVQVTYTQADIDRAKNLVNSITATAKAQVIGDNGAAVDTPVQDDDRSNNIATITPPPAQPRLSLAKNVLVDADAVLLPGTEVQYTLTARNEGNTTIKDVQIQDPMLGTLDCSANEDAIIAPGEEFTCTGFYTVKLEDTKQESADEATTPKTLTNTATVTGKGAGGIDPSPATGSASVQVGAPELTFEKEVLLPDGDLVTEPVRPGQTIYYRIVMENIGNADVTTGKLFDNEIKRWGLEHFYCYIYNEPDRYERRDGFENFGLIKPGVLAVCLARTHFPQDVVDEHSEFTNTAYAQYGDANGNNYTTDTDDAKVTTSNKASISLKKTHFSEPEGVVEGDTVQYEFTVENTGELTLTDVVVTDPLLSNAGYELENCQFATLAPGEQRTCQSKPVTVNEKVLNGYLIENTATVTANKPQDRFPDEQVSDTSDDFIAIGEAALQVQKSLDLSQPGPFGVGDVATFNITVQNSGTVDLENVTLTDALAQYFEGVSPVVECPSRPELVSQSGTTLRVAESTTCTSKVKITQAMVDSVESITNNAEAYGSFHARPYGNASQDSAELKQDAALTLVKSIENQQPLYEAGDELTYLFTVTNSGQRTINNLAISDDKLGQTTPQCAKTSLGAGEKTTCRATVQVTEEQAAADADASLRLNTATATGEDPSGTKVESAPATASFNAGTPALAIEKHARIVSGGVLNAAGEPEVQAGSVVEWAVVVTNGGNAPAVGVEVDDAQFADAQEVACYADVSLDDAKAGNRPAGAGVAPNAVGTIDPGKSVTCFAQTTIAQTQVDAANTTVNTATASRLLPHPTDPDTTRTSTQVATATVNNATLAGITLEKLVAADYVKETYVEGDEVVYTLQVTNTGLVTLSNIVVTDTMFADDEISCPASELAPGKSMTCTTAKHTITREEAADSSGKLINDAAVTGVAPMDRTNLAGVDENNKVSDDDSQTVPVAEPKLVLTKRSDAGSAPVKAKDKVTYTLVATNMGDVPLEQVVIVDPMFAPTDFECEQGKEDAVVSGVGVTLAKRGDSVTCSATRAISQDDVDSGKPLLNTATATAVSNGIPTESTNTDEDAKHKVPVTAEASTEVPVSKVASVRLEKAIDADTLLFTEGDVVPYQFTVTNTGDVTLHDLQITDPMFGDAPLTCDIDPLAPNASTSCTPQKWTVTAEQAAAGENVKNTATVTALTPSQDSSVPVAERVTSSDDATFSTGLPVLEIVKTHDVPAGDKVDVGTVIHYTITVTNKGNTPAERVTLVDAMLSDATVTNIVCSDDAVLASATGATLQHNGDHVTCEFDKQVTQDEVDGFDRIVNTASASAEYGAKKVEPVTVSAEVPVAYSPNITLQKEIKDKQQVYVEGEQVEYAFTVTNNGNVTITQVTIHDKLLADRGVDITCEQTTLAPGAKTECRSAPMTITADDVHAKRVNNVATATSVVPARGESNANPENVGTSENPIVSNEDNADVSTGAPAIEITKTPITQGPVRVGDAISYRITVRNPGPTALEDVVVIDEGVIARGGTLQCADQAFLDGHGTLAIGESTTCTAEETVTSKQLAAGSATNTAATSGSHEGVSTTERTATASIEVVARDSGLVAKIFHTDVETGDGQDAESAVVVSANKPFTATITVENAGESPLAGVGVEVPGVDFATVSFTLTGPGADSPTVATDVPGTVLRVRDGVIVRSDDESLPALVLQPGQTVTATVEVAASQVGSNTPVKATATDDESKKPLVATDPLYTTPNAQTAAITGKIFQDSVSEKDGQTPESAVEITLEPGQTSFPVTVSMTNSGEAPLSDITVTVPNSNVGETVFTVSDPAGRPLTPTPAANNGPGLVLRINPQGLVVLSDNEDWPRLELSQGQQIIGTVSVDASQIGVNTPLTITAIDQSTKNQVSAEDAFYTRRPHTAAPQLGAKIFIDSIETGDGNNPNDPVSVPAEAETVTATVTLTNDGGEPLEHVVPKVEGLTVNDGKTFTLTGGEQTTPTAGIPADGPMLRITPEGTIVFSDDPSLPPLVLGVGQTVTVNVEVTVPAGETVNIPVNASAESTETATNVTGSDPLYVLRPQQPATPTVPPTGSSSGSSIPDWAWLIAAVGIIPILGTMTPALPVPPVVAPTPVPEPQPVAPQTEVEDSPTSQQSNSASDSNLALTGANVIGLLVVALLLVIIGVLLLAAKRRRRDDK